MDETVSLSTTVLTSGPFQIVYQNVNGTRMSVLSGIVSHDLNGTKLHCFDSLDPGEEQRTVIDVIGQ